MFIDEAEIEVTAGKGGDGAVGLRHEKYVPRGGPDGGSGARGGNVIAVADPNLRTLIDVSYRRRYHAENGGPGGPNNRQGARGSDVEIPLPVGTIIREASDGPIITDLVHAGQQVILARGGRGGRGNATFASSTRQTPKFAEKGEPGEQRRLQLELKLLADVGILGLPNVGKSSLIARISSARPKIADYPFTTLVPNLGVVRLEEGESFVVADLPGLVEGAHEGVGRGHDFLRHAERTALFLHVLDVSLEEHDPMEDFDTVNRELALYREQLAARPQIVALNKMDLLPPPVRVEAVEAALRARGYEVLRISALTGAGIRELLGRTWQLLHEVAEPVREEILSKVERRPRPRRPLQVSMLESGRFEVTGDGVERLLAMTDLDNEEAVRYLHRQLERMGVIRRLRTLGAKDGDRVSIGPVVLDFVE